MPPPISHPPSLCEEIETQRAINRRLYEHSLKLDASEVRSDTLIDILRALAVGHACVARLERAHKALTAGEDSQLGVQVAQALNEFFDEFQAGPDVPPQGEEPEGFENPWGPLAQQGDITR